MQIICMSRGIGSKVSESGTYTGVDVLTMMLGMIELHTRVVLKVAQEQWIGESRVRSHASL